jgi:hypothetical protein
MSDDQASLEEILARLTEEAEHEEPDGDGAETSSVSNAEVTKLYVALKRGYRELVERAVRVSRGSGGILSTGNRMFWASVLFTRLSVMSKSVLALLPDPKPREHWDFSSVASLVRNLHEAYLVYFWLCEDEVLDEVRAARFILLYLHDYGSRKRLYPDMFAEDDWVYHDLVRQFDENLFLRTYTESQRRVALRGEKTPFVQDDVLQRMRIDLANFRHMYRFFSQHTHTGPMSFYRMVDHDRGTGVETRHEKRYMIFAISFAVDLLNRAIEGHLLIFPDAETRTPHLTERQIEKNVERNQGRAPPGRRRG